MARPRKPRRRNRGEGSIYPRTRTWTTKDGKTQSKAFWVARTPGNDGKEFAGDTAEEARQRRDDWLRENGKPVARSQRPTPITVEQFAEVFLAHRERTTRPKTHIDYDNTLRRHVLPYIGKDKIGELTDDRCRWLYRTVENKVSLAMAARVHARLRAMLCYAIEQKVIKNSPLAAIRQDVPRYKHPKVYSLDEGQVERLLRAAAGNRLSALFVLAVDSGVRSGELRAVQWPDFDFSGNRVTIRRSVTDVTGGRRIEEGKTPSAQRTIDLSPETMAAVKRRRESAIAEGLGDCPWVFPTRTGEVYTASYFYRQVWYPIREAAGIPGVKLHALRHTTATLLLRAGVHPKIVSERLGHKSVAFTMDVYAAYVPGMQSVAAQAMGAMFSGLARRQKRPRAA